MAPEKVHRQYQETVNALESQLHLAKVAPGFEQGVHVIVLKILVVLATISRLQNLINSANIAH